MKTSNKLLIIFLAVVFLSITAIIVTARIYLRDPSKKGKIVWTDRKMEIPEITKVTVRGHVRLVVNQDTASSTLQIRADQDVMKAIRSEVRDSELVIEFLLDDSHFIRLDHMPEAVLFVKELKAIDLAAGAEAAANGRLVSRKMELSLSSGSAAKFELECEEVVADLSSAARLELSGKARDLMLVCSTGAVARAADLPVKSARIKGTTGSEITVNVSEFIEGALHTGSELNNRGNAIRENVRLHSGATFSRK
jgi:hypothetical protein